MFQICSRCKKRPAVVFITKVENNESKPTGLCLQCARELNVGPIEQIIKQTGLSEEDLDAMMNNMQDLMSEMGEGDIDALIPTDDGPDATGAPAMDLSQLFSSADGDKGEKKAKKGKDTKPREKEKKFLSQFCIDITSRAKEGKLDRIVGREKELDRVIQILCRRQKNNPCLIGEPGVGKTALAEALAQRIADGNVPFKLR
jgi:ATP-dependent Clp protease ATP-binding subunit ClpB/ATP-dependent Clp protease ATP-binding subunit ClpC